MKPEGESWEFPVQLHPDFNDGIEMLSKDFARNCHAVRGLKAVVFIVSFHFLSLENFVLYTYQLVDLLAIKIISCRSLLNAECLCFRVLKGCEV